ncbi:MAG: CPBP family intramembrane metalloprotease [Bellilinea sp.]|nr:CPBP family intramembrane metalloprotease [Bellilinea sp.]
MATQIVKTVKRDQKGLVWFFGITFTFSWLFWIPTVLSVRGAQLPNGLKEFLESPLNPAAFGPLVAALLVTFGEQGGKGVLAFLKRAFVLRFPKIWLVISVLLPMVIFGGAVWLSILVGARSPDLSVLSNPPFALIGFFVILLTSGPLQEEFGWRGYALPRLQTRFSPLVSGVILGFCWWIWHLPAVFIPSRFMANNPIVFTALGIVIILTSLLFTWVFNHTNGSLLTALLFHTAMNWSIWMAMPDMRLDLVTCLLMAVLGGIAVYFVWRNNGLRPIDLRPE